MPELSSPRADSARYVAFERRLRGRGTAYLVWGRWERRAVGHAASLGQAQAEARRLNQPPPAPRRRRRRSERTA